MLIINEAEAVELSKMNLLENLYRTIESSDWDVTKDSDINTYIQKLIAEAQTQDELDSLPRLELERNIFMFAKSSKNGLMPRWTATKTLDDGEKIPIEWPDRTELMPEDFDYIHKRWRECKHLFARTEYGLVLYYCEKLEHNEDALVLVIDLFALAKQYHEKSLVGDDEYGYGIFLKHILANAFHIACKRNDDQRIQNVFGELVRFVTEVHNNWNIEHRSTLRSLIDLTEFALEYRKQFQSTVSLEKYLDQNYLAAVAVGRSYSWGAIAICDLSQKLARAITHTKYDWQLLKAHQFENMIQPAIESGNPASLGYVESALSIYKQLNIQEKVAELSKLYSKLRGEVQLFETKTPFPEVETKRIIAVIEKEVATKTSDELIQTLCITPMFSSPENIAQDAAHLYEQSVLTRMFPSSVIDKHGNTIAVYEEEEDKREFQFWQTYGWVFQMGSQILMEFFLQATKADKIKGDDIVRFLSGTWIGETYTVKYNGYEQDIRPLEALRPALDLYFEELGKWQRENNYEPNFICATDSLVVKSEYILRFFCQRAGIATFKDKPRAGQNLKIEKNVYDLLFELKGKPEFKKEHSLFLRYVLIEKAGMNLRNRVAHGLMDAHEYGMLNPLLLLTVILKLASYEFGANNNDDKS